MKTDNTWAIVANGYVRFTLNFHYLGRSDLIKAFVKWFNKTNENLTWRQIKRLGYSCEKIHIKKGWVE